MWVLNTKDTKKSLSGSPLTPVSPYDSKFGRYGCRNGFQIGSRAILKKRYSLSSPSWDIRKKYIFPATLVLSIDAKMGEHVYPNRSYKRVSNTHAQN